VPEFIDPVFAKTNPKSSFSVIENERFGRVFAKIGSIISGTVVATGPWIVDQRHKVRTYKEYHSVCPSSELGLSQPLSRQRVFPSPQKQGGGGTLACGWGVGGGVPIPTRGVHCGTLYMYVLCDLRHSRFRDRQVQRPPFQS
jgi:hypothetical protein